MGKAQEDDVNRLVAALKSSCPRGIVGNVEKRFGIRFGEYRRSKNGIPLTLTLDILDFAGIPPAFFFGSDLSKFENCVESRPDWWDRFNTLRHNYPHKALELVADQSGSWYSAARAWIAAHWGQFDLARREAAKVRDTTHRLRLFSLANSVRKNPEWSLYFSDLAAASALYSGRDNETLSMLKLERSFLMRLAGKPLEQVENLIIQAVTIDGASPMIKASAWQNLARYKLDDGLDCERELELAKEAGYKSNNYLGSWYWAHGLLKKDKDSFNRAVQYFGSGFPCYTALVAVDYAVTFGSGGAAGMAAEILRKCNHTALAVVVENAMAVSALSRRPPDLAQEVNEIWERGSRRRFNRLVQRQNPT